MSQSSNSAMNMNIFSELSTITTDDKVMSTEAEKGMKRAASEQLQGQGKKIMIDHHASSSTPKSLDQPKFVSASEMIINNRTSIQQIPEISDEEFLKMAIEFEKLHPQ
ncbi:unnamed protein product [Adineta steineri]|uniref:Uncharacterized protein n=1 Tax=Adineta steineri TaxID=433720 RepID=A0A819VK90_9BILA|nr:unnamed protein product [Adineta steineri]